MILTDKKMLEFIKKGKIKISPFDEKCLGCNSYDIHLSPNFAQYIDPIIDAKKNNELKHFIIPEEGFVLEPGQLYLGSTVEYTETHDCVPYLEGKSSTGRLGINIHATAGKGDIGFCGHWTLEISTSIPVKIYPGMPIGQITYFKIYGDVKTPYYKKVNAKYSGQCGKPVGSSMYKNFL